MRFRYRRRPHEDGTTAVEYALVIGFISLLLLAGTVGLGGLFSDRVDELATIVTDLLT